MEFLKHAQDFSVSPSLSLSPFSLYCCLSHLGFCLLPRILVQWNELSNNNVWKYALTVKLFCRNLQEVIKTLDWQLRSTFKRFTREHSRRSRQCVKEVCTQRSTVCSLQFIYSTSTKNSWVTTLNWFKNKQIRKDSHKIK